MTGSNVESSYALPGARLRLRVEVVAVMTAGTGSGSGVRSDVLFAASFPPQAVQQRDCKRFGSNVVAMQITRGNRPDVDSCLFK
jgi:hypothetical protein